MHKSRRTYAAGLLVESGCEPLLVTIANTQTPTSNMVVTVIVTVFVAVIQLLRSHFRRFLGILLSRIL
jgi:hypothetical protein